MHESMFETFLKTAHQNDKKAADERALVEAMKKLPPEVLFKIANGETKLGSSYLKACSPGGCDGMEWVEQFKDTPLFEQALQLEQQAIQVEQMEQQFRAQRDAEREQEPKFWEMQDRIRLQKRLLGLQLAATQLQGAMPPSAASTTPPPATEPANGAAPSPTDGKVVFVFPAVGGALAGALEGSETQQAGRGALLGGIGAGAGALGGGIAGNVLGQGVGHFASGGSQHGRAVGGLVGGALGQLGGGALGYMKGRERLHEKPETKEALDRAAEMGRRMAHGDYERAVTTNLATELGGDLAKVAFALTEAGHKFDAADYAAQRDMYGKRREAREEYNTTRPGLSALHTIRELPMAVPANAAGIIGSLAVGAPSIGGSGLLSAVRDTLGERHMDYAAKQHEAGGNAINPFGGYLTPTAREKKHNESKEKKALATGALAGLGQKAVGFLRSNPGAAIGTAAGAAGGLAHGLQKDDQGQRHLLRGVAEGVAGGALGAAAGHATSHFAKAMGHRPEGLSLGQRVTEAAGATGRQMKYQGEQALGAVRNAFKPAPSAGGMSQPGWNPVQTPKMIPQAASSTANSAALAPTVDLRARSFGQPTAQIGAQTPVSTASQQTTRSLVGPGAPRTTPTMTG